MAFKVRYKPLHHIYELAKQPFILLRQLFERGKLGLGVFPCKALPVNGFYALVGRIDLIIVIKKRLHSAVIAAGIRYSLPAEYTLCVFRKRNAFVFAVLKKAFIIRAAFKRMHKLMLKEHNVTLGGAYVRIKRNSICPRVPFSVCLNRRIPLDFKIRTKPSPGRFYYARAMFNANMNIRRIIPPRLSERY